MNPPALRAWNGQTVAVGTGEASSARVLRGYGMRLSITGDRGKWQAATTTRGRTIFTCSRFIETGLAIVELVASGAVSGHRDTLSRK